MRRPTAALTTLAAVTLLTQGFIVQEKKEQEESQGYIAVDLLQLDFAKEEGYKHQLHSQEPTPAVLTINNQTLLLGKITWSAPEGILREWIALEGKENRKIMRDRWYDQTTAEEMVAAQITLEQYNRAQGYTSNVWAPREMYGEWALGGANFEAGSTRMIYEMTTVKKEKVCLEQRVHKIRPKKQQKGLLQLLRN